MMKKTNMMKKTYKVMALSTLVTTLAMGSIAPSYASAAEKTTKATQSLASKYADRYGLGPEALKKAIANTKSNMLVVDLYALTLVKQATPDLNGVSAVSEDVKTNVTTSFDTARKDANKWLDSLKPQIIDINQSIINYNTKFQAYSTTLIKAAKSNNIPTLQKGLTRLLADIEGNQKKVAKLVDDLKDYRKKVSTNTQNFKDYSEKVVSALAGQESGIPQMEQQIAANQKLIDQNNKLVAAAITGTVVGSVLTATVFFAPFGAPILGLSAYGVDKLNTQMNQARTSIMDLTKNISNAKLQVGKLTILKNTTTELTTTIDLAVTALQNIKDQWGTMESKYNSVIQNLNKVDPELVDFLEADLATAQGSWDDVKKLAESLQKSEIGFVENKK